MRELRIGMTEDFSDLAIHESRKGDGEYIRFSHTDTLEEAAGWMPLVIKIDYMEGYAVFGMPEMYTMRMLAMAFVGLAQIE
jgi:hypothetical protein